MPFSFFGIWFLLELFVLVAVSQAIGFLSALGLLILGAVAGSYLIRQQQAAFMQAMVNPQMATRSAEGGMFRLLAGILLLIPGFISDVLAVCLLVPVLRRLFGGSMLRAFKPDIVVNRFGFGSAPRNVYEHDGTVEAKRDDGTVIEGEFISRDEGSR